ncbi:dual specificity protein phosphatase family protein [Sinorhizobium meliloti]|uniref:dual specificity protein phosphatase family protein n=1 Tax=Rhizobium meliloti TaxID=382 RepID=UPI000474DA24|nr:dual specificity protein phosphatase family protein [Sinorhizobium meliloti]MDE3876139.1 dual specificity protein phosphatase family protein [Sinorhizobium meliloti]MQX61573.1 protein tyrosine phosphatase [Sinorhizobium meliloti]RVO72001.1 protein tyrosine phosphatase [Sinorhizobium meliloti]
MNRFLKAIAGTAWTTALVFGGYLGVLQLTGNFHEVLPAELYRSAQPSAADIATYARQYGIKTIVNLRGKSMEAWYLQEVEAAGHAGITHFDFRLSAAKRVSPQQARQLIALLQTAPKPILIHCQAGADRTGLASMLYLQQIAGTDEEISERQLSVRYGHIGLPYISAAFAMDESWEILEEVLFGLTS